MTEKFLKLPKDSKEYVNTLVVGYTNSGERVEAVTIESRRGYCCELLPTGELIEYFPEPEQS